MHNDIKFTVRTPIVLVAFAAWLAAIIGVIVMVGYGVILGIHAMSGLDSDTLSYIGYGVIAVFVCGTVLLAVRDD